MTVDETLLCIWAVVPRDDALLVEVESCFGEVIDWALPVAEAERFVRDLQTAIAVVHGTPVE